MVELSLDSFVDYFELIQILDAWYNYHRVNVMHHLLSLVLVMVSFIFFDVVSAAIRAKEFDRLTFNANKNSSLDYLMTLTTHLVTLIFNIQKFIVLLLGPVNLQLKPPF